MQVVYRKLVYKDLISQVSFFYQILSQFSLEILLWMVGNIIS